ncbi:hypothetical protein BsWGS_14496 [Bradybaena similaris]
MFQHSLVCFQQGYKCFSILWFAFSRVTNVSAFSGLLSAGLQMFQHSLVCFQQGYKCFSILWFAFSRVTNVSAFSGLLSAGLQMFQHSLVCFQQGYKCFTIHKALEFTRHLSQVLHVSLVGSEPCFFIF